MSTPADAAPRLAPRPRRLAAIVLIFVVIGPLVGGIALVEATGKPGSIFKDPVLIVGMSYVIGGLPALAAGILTGVAQVFYGNAPWHIALIVGALVGASFVLAMFAILGERASDMHLVSKQSAAMILTCMLGTMVCWAIVRAWYRLAPPAAEAVPEC